MHEAILAIMKKLDEMNICTNCGAPFAGKTCTTCDATRFVVGDAFTRLCNQCSKGFATADPRRDLCCFCMQRTGEFSGRNRRAHSTPSCRPDDTARPRARTGTAWTIPSIGRAVPAPGPIKSAGIRTGEIIGWRAWRLTKKGVLRSMAVDCLWQPGQTVSVNSVLEQCGYPDRWNRMPVAQYGAGIHAFKDLQTVADNYGVFRRGAYGTVALWGEVIEHEWGYRAEFARIASIDLAFNEDGQIDYPRRAILCQRYNVGVSRTRS